jgi:hypothetical protein
VPAVTVRGNMGTEEAHTSRDATGQFRNQNFQVHNRSQTVTNGLWRGVGQSGLKTCLTVE